MLSDLKIFKKFLESCDETRETEDITLVKLKAIIKKFAWVWPLIYQIRVSYRIFVKLNQIQFTCTLASLTINLFMIWALGILFVPNERNRTVYRRACFFIWNFLGYTAGFYPLYNDMYLHISSQSVGCKALLLPVSTVQNPRLDYACSLVLHGHDKQDDAMGFYLYDRKETVENKSDQVIFLMSFTRNLSFLPRRSAVSSAVTW